jgi:hypothetical protein
MPFGAIGAIVVNRVVNAEWRQRQFVKGDGPLHVCDGYENVIQHERFLMVLPILQADAALAGQLKALGFGLMAFSCDGCEHVDQVSFRWRDGQLVGDLEVHRLTVLEGNRIRPCVPIRLLDFANGNGFQRINQPFFNWFFKEIHILLSTIIPTLIGAF